MLAIIIAAASVAVAFYFAVVVGSRRLRTDSTFPALADDIVLLLALQVARHMREGEGRIVA